MPHFLDKLVESLNAGRQAAAQPAAQLADELPEPETVVRPEMREEVPWEPGEDAETPAAAGLGGGGGESRAAGPVDDRRMVVMPPEGGGEMAALVGVVQGIALMGLPAGGAATRAVGSKI